MNRKSTKPISSLFTLASLIMLCIVNGRRHYIGVRLAF
jgi:hypothetical protein